MHLCVLTYLPTVCLIYAAVSNAIFADEAYQTDYHHALLGFPQAQTTFFHRSSFASKASLLYTLSQRLILGAINPKDGAVVWRQRLTDKTRNDTGLSLLKAGEGGDTIVSSVHGKVQSWDTTDGRLGWEWRSERNIRSLEITEGGRDVLIVSGDDSSESLVRKLAANTGELLWEHKDDRYAASRWDMLALDIADSL